MKSDLQTTIDSGQGAGGGSLAGYEYQIDVSVWLALDLLLGSKQARELVLEPDTEEDVEAELNALDATLVKNSASVGTYRLVVQAKLRTGDAWTVPAIKALLRHGKRRTSVRERLRDSRIHYLLVTSAALNGGVKGLQVTQVGVWPKAVSMPAAMRNALHPGSAGRVAVIGNKDEERLKNDIRDLLRESFRVPNAHWQACWRNLRDEARARISGAGGGLWTRDDLEDVVKKHEGYVASSPELGLYVYPNNWDELRGSMRDRHAALVVGQSGTGKTLAAQKLYEELSAEIPGLSRVPITRGPDQLRDDRTVPPVLYDIEDPWGRFDFEPKSRPWNDQLAQSFSNATHDRMIVATTRLDVAQRSGALDTVEQWQVSLEAENYGDLEKRQLYRSRIAALSRDLRVTANNAQATVLKALSTPLEIQKFFDAMSMLDREGLRNPKHFVSEAIGRAHQNSIERTVVDQIEQRSGGVRAAAVIWGLLKATNKLSLPVLRTIEEAIADRDSQMIAEASSLVSFFVAARNLKQSEDIVTYYHPRVESGIERALVRAPLETKRTLRLLIDVLTSSDGPGEDWGTAAATRLIAAIRESNKFEVAPKAVAAAKVDAWLAARLEEPGEGLEANLRLAAAAGSSSSCRAEVARYLFHDSVPGFGPNSWDAPEKDEDWYARMRSDPATPSLLERFIREILPFSHMRYGADFAKDVKRLSPCLAASFLTAADRTVTWGYFSSDDAIAEGSLEDLTGFEEIVDAACEALTPTKEELRKQQEQRLALANGEYSEHYAEHLSDNDDGYTAGEYLEAYVDRVRATVGWKQIAVHRHRDRLRAYWLRAMFRSPQGVALAKDELAGAFESAYGTEDEDDLWYVVLRYWEESFLPTLRQRLLTGATSQKITIAAVACLVSQVPEQLKLIGAEFDPLDPAGRLLEIAAALAHLRDRRPFFGDKSQEAAIASMGLLPATVAEISDAYLELYNRRTPFLGEAARNVLKQTAYRSEDIRRLRLAANVDSGERAAADVEYLLRHAEDADVAAEAMAAAARMGMQHVVDSGLHHKFADVRAVALEALGNASPIPLPESLLDMAEDKGYRVRRVLAELLSEKVHSCHEEVLLKLAQDKLSDLTHYYGGPDSYPIARAAVTGLSKYESLSSATKDTLYKSAIGTDDPEVRSSIFGVLAAGGDGELQDKLLTLAITPGRTSVRQSAAWALLLSRQAIAPEVVAKITPALLESRIESVATVLTLVFAARADLERVSAAAEYLAASLKRKVLLLLIIRRVIERDKTLAKQIALMLPADHPALSWAYGEELAEAKDDLVADLGDPGICSEVIFFMKPLKN